MELSFQRYTALERVFSPHMVPRNSSQIRKLHQILLALAISLWFGNIVSRIDLNIEKKNQYAVALHRMLPSMSTRATVNRRKMLFLRAK